ncbi:hypothetical protein [Fusobacterium hwasookii]|uniref:Uncharacterized protein n=1 Tax=Fusobacterium hwasookii ChDC F128 TaxID=1216362 RepID=A0ABP2R7G9_9FUSO|nr:hypothetical protein [Fusobacterium hwasookii]EJU08841.1 hypothetical protein B437_01905 [Fusobacterium hwasookii ChDC F128]QNE66901.1 hypothetical protein H5V36_03215 [Fusobacterium hwasookii]
MGDFMFEKKEVIIVYDNESKGYCDYLFALISTKKDTVARCLSLQQYEETNATLSSENNIIFIGNNKITENKIKYTNNTFKKYGMNYGWIGRHCMLYVEDEMLEQDEYREFIDYTSKINTKFKEENMSVLAIQQNSSIVSLFSLFTPILGLGYMAYKLYSNYSDNKKKIKDQQYGTLINIFFTNGLDKFLGE